MKAKVGRPKKEINHPIRRLQLRLPLEIVSNIDQHCEKSPTTSSRHAWLVEAVIEKLQREDETEHILRDPILVRRIEKGLRELKEKKFHVWQSG